MIIIDAFLFSEPSEREVLLTKFHLGSAVVTEWILLENSYTFRGEYKGLRAHEVLADPAFAPFRERVTVVSTEIKFPLVHSQDSNGDAITFVSQYAQRDSVMEYLDQKWAGRPDAWLLISDTDECLDGSTTNKRTSLLNWTRLGSDLLVLDRKRFWFDFDNVWPAQRFTPLVRISALRGWFGPGHSLGTIRGPLIRSWPSAGLRGLLYEYSACYGLAAVRRKYDTVGHVGMQQPDLDRALACNHRPQFRIKGQQVGLGRDDWLERVRLTERNSPDYVRENFERLRTRNIADNYVENRKRFYPGFFSPLGQLKRKGHALYEDLRDTYASVRIRFSGGRFPTLV
jgi:hypothetical protein